MRNGLYNSISIFGGCKLFYITYMYLLLGFLT